MLLSTVTRSLLMVIIFEFLFLKDRAASRQQPLNSPGAQGAEGMRFVNLRSTVGAPGGKVQ